MDRYHRRRDAEGLRIVPGEKHAIDALVAELADAVNRRGIVN